MKQLASEIPKDEFFGCLVEGRSEWFMMAYVVGMGGIGKTYFIGTLLREWGSINLLNL